MTRLSDFIALYRIYRHHFPPLNAARYAWLVAGELNHQKE